MGIACKLKFSTEARMTSQCINSDGENLVWIIYDGDCPFCRNYVRYLRLKETAGEVRLVDAREGGDLVRRLHQENYNLDQGMVAIVSGRTYSGDEAIHVLALLSSPVGWFNALNRAIFSTGWVARILYPVMRAGRRIVLIALGKKLINRDAAGTDFQR